MARRRRKLKGLKGGGIPGRPAELRRGGELRGESELMGEERDASRGARRGEEVILGDSGSIQLVNSNI